MAGIGERVIVALDVDSADKAAKLVGQLSGTVGAFKVGLELVNAVGVGVIRQLEGAGAGRIFYDAKLHDIPNTVAGACRSVARMGVWMVNVHAAGGKRMISAAAEALREGAESAAAPPPMLIAVTLLTSLSTEELHGELLVDRSPCDYMVSMARMAQDAGAAGVVASPHEIDAIREACGTDFVIVTPGVRPAGADQGDQRRTMTPRQAIDLGADYLVIGRPITAASDPNEAARAIAAE